MSEKNINDIAALFDRSYWAIEWRAGSFYAGPIHVEKTAYEHESLLLFWNKWITDIGFGLMWTKTACGCTNRIRLTSSGAYRVAACLRVGFGIYSQQGQP
ncbi:MAG: hypothetical protein ACRYFS_20760 [Janthinobacterium lividum]